MGKYDGQETFTTSEAADICNVSQCLIQKWFDSGRLRGYRVPGSRHRRIPRPNLIVFLKAHGMPLGELEECTNTEPSA